MSVATDLTTAIALYASQLAADAVAPQPSYSLDGKAVSRNEWREGLARQIVALSKTLNAQAPYIVATKHVL